MSYLSNIVHSVRSLLNSIRSPIVHIQPAIGESIRCKHSSIRCNMDLETLVNQLKDRKLTNIAVINTPFDCDPEFLVLASSFNQRHLNSSTELLNKYYKRNVKDSQSDFAKISESPGWNVIDFDSIVVHLFLPQVRQKYDIEQLWCVGEEYDELINNPVEEQPLANYKYFIDKLREQEETDEKSSKI